MFELSSSIVFILFLLIWGMSVIADSPMFSTLVAQNAPSQLKGTALTLVNSIGFFVSILSIEILNSSIAGNTIETTNTNIFLILAIGPVLGLISLLQKQKLGS
jgi:MFS family permease